VPESSWLDSAAFDFVAIGPSFLTRSGGPLYFALRKEIVMKEREMASANKSIGNFYDLIVEIGHSLYRGSVSVKDCGERIGVLPLIWIGKLGRSLSMRFPVK